MNNSLIGDDGITQKKDIVGPVVITVCVILIAVLVYLGASAILFMKGGLYGPV